MIASAVKKIFNEIGILEPSNDKIPRENAISVADGMAQPFNVSVLLKFIQILIHTLHSLKRIRLTTTISQNNDLNEKWKS